MSVVDPRCWWIFSNGEPIYTARNAAERDELIAQWRAWFTSRGRTPPTISYAWTRGSGLGTAKRMAA